MANKGKVAVGFTRGTYEINAECHCSGGEWRMEVTIKAHIEVYYANNIKGMTASFIRAEEDKHVASIKSILGLLKAEGTLFQLA